VCAVLGHARIMNQKAAARLSCERHDFADKLTFDGHTRVKHE
jgi:hypothetical protein